MWTMSLYSVVLQTLVVEYMVHWDDDDDGEFAVTLELILSRISHTIPDIPLDQGT